MDITYEQIKKQESAFINESFDTTDSYTILQGSGPVLVSAPHSVIQTRDGKPKQGEFLTGVLVQLLHQSTGCCGAFKTKHNNDDANYDPVNPYKDALVKHVHQHPIKTILDLHIMSDKRPHNIDIGTANGRNLAGNETIVNLIINQFHHHHIDKVEVDNIFTAGNPNTVSSTLHRETGITAVQIEINWRLFRMGDGDLSKFGNIFSSLEGIVMELQK